MDYRVPKEELEKRINKFLYILDELKADTALIISRVNQYYFTGTMQNGILIFQDGKAYYFTRKSYERAKEECPLEIIYQMNSYKDMLNEISPNMGRTFLETEVMPIATSNRIQKYFKMQEINSIDNYLLMLRSVKSEYELGIIKESAKAHNYLCENIIPSILKEGMSEADFAAELYEKMIKQGHHGVSRFSMFQMEMIIGQIGFGKSSIYPTNFDGPGGMLGMYPSVPIVGNRERMLKKGDLVFVDVGFGMKGYHSDKTQVYSFGRRPSQDVIDIHNACKDVLKKAKGLLGVGKLPSDIYEQSIKDLPEVLNENFMGYGRGVKFLGHGVGLHIDEWPVIANGFDMPLEENMVIALEPKCGIKDVGTVGVEETFLVTKDGPICLTGGAKDILVV